MEIVCQAKVKLIQRQKLTRSETALTESIILKLIHTIATVVALFGALISMAATAEMYLQGDQKDACQALMCLSTSQRPNQCTPPIERYFGIKARKPSDTLRMRQNFLNLCPASNQSSEMRMLVTAISSGAGSCDPASLNQLLRRQEWISGNGDSAYYISVIGNQLPAFCEAYLHSNYVDQASLAARYVGTPVRNGFWVQASNYEAALRAWSATIVAEDAAAAAALRQSQSDSGRY